MSKPLAVPLQGTPCSPAADYFRRNSSAPHASSSTSTAESALLSAVRLSLRGSGTERNDAPAGFHSILETVWVDDPRYCGPLTVVTEDQELAWNETTVILSVGGVIRKKWTFKEENQPIQWACIGLLELNVPLPSWLTVKNPKRKPTSAKQQSDGATAEDSESQERPTFGPFARMQQEDRARHKGSHGVRRKIHGAFIFLRTMGHVFLNDGLHFTFNLPFVVRKAWPLSPHGVMLQRTLEPSEVEEAASMGEPVLPTLFSFTSPLAEPAPVGVTEGIVGGLGKGPTTLTDEQDQLKCPLTAMPASEMVVSVLRRGPKESGEEILVTVDVEKRKMSVWRYGYVKPKDTPTHLPTAGSETAFLELGHKTKRRSMSGLKRHTTAQSDWLDRQHGIQGSPKMASRQSTILDLDTTGAGGNAVPAPELAAAASVLAAANMGKMALMSSTSNEGGSLPGWPSPSVSEEFPPGMTRSLSSRTHNELSTTMDRMALGAQLSDPNESSRHENPETTFATGMNARMQASYWVQKLYETDIQEEYARNCSKISVALFDTRFTGVSINSYVAFHFPGTAYVKLYVLSQVVGVDALRFVESAGSKVPAIAMLPVISARADFWDLLLVKPDGSLALLTHGLREVPLAPVTTTQAPSHFWLRRAPVEQSNEGSNIMEVDLQVEQNPRPIAHIKDHAASVVTLVFADGTEARADVDFRVFDRLTAKCMLMLSTTLSSEHFWNLRVKYLQLWSERGRRIGNAEFRCFEDALDELYGLKWRTRIPESKHLNHFEAMAMGQSHQSFREDAAMKGLRLPPSLTEDPAGPLHTPIQPHPCLVLVLFALHVTGEDMRLTAYLHVELLKLVPIICKLALIVRPEWADYWKRLVPDCMAGWPQTVAHSPPDDRLPVWPPDVTALLYNRLANPDWKLPSYEGHMIAANFKVLPSFELGQPNTLPTIAQLTELYSGLADEKEATTRMRAWNAVLKYYKTDPDMDLLRTLPLGIMTPLKEAMRTCQLIPPGAWPSAPNTLIGRDDLAALVSPFTNFSANMLYRDGYKSKKQYSSFNVQRKKIGDLTSRAVADASGTLDAITGVELDLEEFTEIRFGQDRRLEEVARMLSSSQVASVRMVERPDQSEHDQAKEHQALLARTAERTLALSYGRAMFTYGSEPTITKEAHVIPKLELDIRIQPHNALVTAEPGKIPPECIHWGEFHNGVAAGLRISSDAQGIESSWIAFNKPAELTPEHAGFLFGLGLTGHLKQLMTWNTFSYLTPKHDHTSIGLLLGLAAANVGTGDDHVTKLLAVHTPAFLPTPDVDLNVSLTTQSAGLAGMGLLYMGMKDRKRAEVCIGEISRRDLNQPGLSSESREAYTYSAALAFGMIMLGKGAWVPADRKLVLRLRVLIHGDRGGVALGHTKKPTFDVNLTSPAATIALGLMYLRTERQDIADLMTIPDSVVALNDIPPSFLMMRTLGRNLIMWSSVEPNAAWLSAQVPGTIAKAMQDRFKGHVVDDAFELAYFNLVAGCCFVIGLKYAGTARSEAFTMIITYYDLFNRLMYQNGPAFEHKIKRAAIRESLNIISISLSMVMAGTGELGSLRRFRMSYGANSQAFKYGTHLSTHVSLGLLFLGGGRYTLGTSNAAIACMAAAFFPRFHNFSSDNKSYLQALRHLWVLAAEPRCLIARDVDTNEVVYLPVKITTEDRDGKLETAQLISPTLIPDLDKLRAIRIDTPRYWPFYLDLKLSPRHRITFLRTQTLFVKRRTAFLSYTEDPRGSRSLFVRSGSSTSDAAALDFPQVSSAKQAEEPHEVTSKMQPSHELAQFISSFSNDALFLAFADHLSPSFGDTPQEHTFYTYCHATLLDSILQDKTKTLQSHLTLFHYRTMAPTSRYFNLKLQDLRFAADFYNKVYDRRFSGSTENNARSPLLREATVAGTLHVLDRLLEDTRTRPSFLATLKYYVGGEDAPPSLDSDDYRHLAWYLLRNAVPATSLLVVLRSLAQDAQQQCLSLPPPDGTPNTPILEQGIKDVLHWTGTKMMTSLGSGWSIRSLEEIVAIWGSL